jgi:hypothetical protein
MKRTAAVYIRVSKQEQTKGARYLEGSGTFTSWQQSTALTNGRYILNFSFAEGSAFHSPSLY